MAFVDGSVIDRHAGVIDGVVTHARRIGLRCPAKAVDGTREVVVPRRMQFVDGHHLARARFGEQIVVVVTPPGRGVAAETAPGVLRAAARALTDVHDAYLEHVARLGLFDIYRPGAHMHAKALARAAPEDRRIEWTGTAPLDRLAAGVPVKHALGARVVTHHAFHIVGGVLGECLDGDAVARPHACDRL